MSEILFHPFEIGDELILRLENNTLIVHKLKGIKPADKSEIYRIIDIIDDKVLFIESQNEKLAIPLDMSIAPEEFPYDDVIISS